MFRLFVLAAVIAFSKVSTAAEPAPLERYAALSPDSADARQAVITEDAKAFRIAFDAALASVPKRDPRWSSVFPHGALDYLNATRDSLLLSDLAFAKTAGTSALKKWHEATQWDESGSASQNADPAKAVPLLRRAAETYREVRHLRREAVAWGTLGVACWNAGDLDCVEDAYTRALAKRRELADSLLIGRTLNGIGSLHFRRGDYDSALVYYQEARAVRERLGRKADLGTTIAYIGNVYYRLGNLGAARRHYQEALVELGPDGPQKPVSDAKAGLANVLSELGEYQEAARVYSEEATAADARGDARWAAVLRGNLGLELSRMGDHAQALKELDLARDTLAALPDTFELARIMNAIGFVYLDMTDFPRALKGFEEAERLATASGNQPVLGSALVNLGTTYVEMGLMDRSRASFDHALEQYESLEDSLGMDEVNLKLALVMYKKGQHAEALELHRRSLAWNAAQGSLGRVALAHASIASVLDAMGDFDTARKEYHTGAELARKLGRNDVLWRCYLGIGNTFESSGPLDSARVYNERAIDVLEGLRGRSFSEETKAAFLGKWSYVYEAQIHVLAKLNRQRPAATWIEEAWTTAERGKARAFLDALSAGVVDLEASLDPATRSRKQELELTGNELRHRLRQATSGVSTDTLKVWKAELQEAESQLAEIDERSRRENPRLATLGAERPLTLADMRRRLLAEEGALLLEYSLGDSASYVFAITGKENRLVALPPRGEIEPEVRKLRSVLSSPLPSGDAQFVESATRLYRMLLSPIADLLRGKGSVIIVPDGLLHLLPYDVLFEKPPAEIPADGEARGAFFAKLPYALGLGACAMDRPLAFSLSCPRNKRGPRKAAVSLRWGIRSFRPRGRERIRPASSGFRNLAPRSSRSRSVSPRKIARCSWVATLGKAPSPPLRRSVVTGSFTSPRTVSWTSGTPNGPAWLSPTRRMQRRTDISRPPRSTGCVWAPISWSCPHAKRGWDAWCAGKGCWVCRVRSSTQEHGRFW